MSSSFIYIFFGGGLGALSRFYLSSTLENFSFLNSAIAVLTINALGAFLAGVLKNIPLLHTPPYTYLLFIGFLASFTTFSTFCLETWKIGEVKGLAASFMYLTVTNLTAFLFFFLGDSVKKYL
jgi:fluoride exporter